MRTLGLERGGYGIATIHRAENTAPAELATLLQALNQAATRFGCIVFPVHPRTAVLRSGVAGWQPAPNLRMIEPLGYLDMLALLQGGRWVLTDSGGLQKEAYFLGCPVPHAAQRNRVDRDTLHGGANHLAGSDGGRLLELLTEEARRPARPYGETPAAREARSEMDTRRARIVAGLCELAETRS